MVRMKDRKYRIDFDISLTKTQQDIWDAVFSKSVKYIVCNISRQQGKTTLAECLLIRWLMNENEKIIYITPQKTLARKVYNDLYDMLEPTGVIRSFNSVYLTIKSVTCSTVQFFSTEQMDAMRGQSATRMILDEAAFYRNKGGVDIFNNIIWPIFKVRGKKMLMISTPNGKQGFFYDYAMRAMSGTDRKMCYICRTIYDDGLIGKDEIEKIRKTYPPAAWEQEFMCQFLSNALSAIEDFEQCFTDDYHYDESQSQWIGVDLSANGEDNTILTKVNESGQVKSIEITGTLDEKYKKLAYIINTTPNLVCAYAEKNSVGEPMINEIKKPIRDKSKFKSWLTTNSTKIDIVNLLSLECTNKELTFDKKDEELFAEFSVFERKLPKNGGYAITFAARDGFHDDRVMSCAIAVMCRKLEHGFSGKDYHFVRRKNKNIV